MLMPRPKKLRNISEPPKFQKFKPAGIRSLQLKKIKLSVDEYEAVRLADYLGLDHLEASKKMQISRPTFSRLIEKARKKISIAIIEGKELIISGGNFQFEHFLLSCNQCSKTFRHCELKDQSILKCPYCQSTDIQDLNFRYHGKHSQGCRNRSQNKSCHHNT